jgi:micrococcal nuclease
MDLKTCRRRGLGLLLLILALTGCSRGEAARMSELESTPSTAPPSTPTPTGPIATAAPAVPAESAQTEVLSVTDGDTLRLLVDGINESVRLIGINAPEGGECLAAEAARRLGELVSAEPISLESDVSDRDRFDRLLRYVHAGEVLVNEELVREGLALAVRHEPDVAEAARLEAAQAVAAAAGAGLWGRDACGPAVTDAVEIGLIRYDAAGDDNDNLNDEWVELSNAGDDELDLSGWRVKDESANHRYRFPAGFVLEAGHTVRLHTGCGEDTPTSLYWCNQGSAVWNNSGDTVFVLDPNGNVVVAESY